MVREIRKDDIGFICDYWHNSDPKFLIGMGVDLQKIPSRNQLSEFLVQQINAPFSKKSSYALIWNIDNIPAGHCNVNKIKFGEEGFMHLHLWKSSSRKKGLGFQLVKLSLPYFFENLQLETIYCEPYSLNPAPNKLLKKLGFEFEREYTTIPGSINFEQPVRRWRLTKKSYHRRTSISEEFD